MGITVLDGDFGSFSNIEPAQGGMKYWEKLPGEFLPHRQFAEVEKLEFVQANTTGGGFNPLMGAIGDAAIGPAGLLLGAKGKTKETVYFRCTLKDGRAFTGSTSAQEYQQWRFLLTNKYATSINSIITAVVIIAIAIFIVYLIGSL